MATNRIDGTWLRDLADRYELDEEDDVGLRAIADRMSPQRRSVTVDADPIQAIRDKTMTRHQEALAAYSEAYVRIYGRPDPTIEGRALHHEALLRSRLVVRNEFDGDPLRSAVFYVCALRWFRARGRAHRWPGNKGDPTFESVTHRSILKAYRSGEINRELG